MNTSSRSSSPHRERSWLFFAVALGWSWVLWLAAIVLGLSVESPAGGILMLLGLLGPMVAAILFTYLNEDKAGRRSYWARIVAFRRIPLRWYAVIFLIMPVLNVIAAGIDRALGGTGATWGEAARQILTEPFSLVMLFVFAALAPFIEELGWRGYILDRLQQKHSALVSSLVLGVIWSLWHLPLFFVADTYQAGLGVGTMEFWLFLFGIVPLNVLFSWVYNNAGRVTLAAILLHSMVNFTGEIIAITPRADAILMGVLGVAAVVLTGLYGPATLTGRRAPRPAAGPAPALGD